MLLRSTGPPRHGVPRGGCVDCFFEMYGDRILPSPGPFRTGLCFIAVIFCPEGVRIYNLKGSALHTSCGVTGMMAIVWFVILSPDSSGRRIWGRGVTPPPYPEFLHCVQDDNWGKVAKGSVVLGRTQRWLAISGVPESLPP